MTKNEEKLLRVALAIITNILVKDFENGVRYINERIRKHPEKYDIEFITETGFTEDEISRLLRVREERLSSSNKD